MACTKSWGKKEAWAVGGTERLRECGSCLKNRVVWNEVQ